MEDQPTPYEIVEGAVTQLPVTHTALSFRLNNAIVVKSEPHGGTAESIHALRAHLVARHIRTGRRGLVVCETNPAHGAFVAVNLAASLADAGMRILLVDADFRRPQLPGFVAASEPVTSLAEVIDDPDRPLGSAIHEVSPNFSVAYAGDAALRAQEMLTSSRLHTFFNLSMHHFDQTIAIAPPANFYSDVRRLASILRYAAIVARRDVSFVDDLKALIYELTSDGAKVIGTIYNDF